MDNKAATLLQKYVRSNTPKYGPSDTDMSNGPGGASAMNMRYSRMAALAPKAGVRAEGTNTQQERMIQQMQDTMDTYKKAAQALAPKGNRKRQLQLNPDRSSGTDI